ncbi:MAG TPA: hypothetical protein VFS23_07350 [Vicinamibacterales bacterium]|nr:hypothetical protein [Vicinamibacterales bacterium]
MIQRPTRSELIEIVALIAAATAVTVGLDRRVLTPVHMAFIAGNYTMYLIWCAANSWRERTRRREGS